MAIKSTINHHLTFVYKVLNAELSIKKYPDLIRPTLLSKKEMYVWKHNIF